MLVTVVEYQQVPGHRFIARIAAGILGLARGSNVGPGEAQAYKRRRTPIAGQTMVFGLMLGASLVL